MFVLMRIYTDTCSEHNVLLQYLLLVTYTYIHGNLDECIKIYQIVRAFPSYCPAYETFLSIWQSTQCKAACHMGNHGQQQGTN